jgi:hypothetical protein
VVSHVKTVTWAEGVREWGAEKDIWAKWVQTMGDWRKLQNDELRGLYSSPNIVPVIKLRGLRWTGHVARMWDKKMLIGFWMRKPAKKGTTGKI